VIHRLEWSMRFNTPSRSASCDPASSLPFVFSVFGTGQQIGRSPTATLQTWLCCSSLLRYPTTDVGGTNGRSRRRRRDSLSRYANGTRTNPKRGSADRRRNEASPRSARPVRNRGFHAEARRTSRFRFSGRVPLSARERLEFR